MALMVGLRSIRLVRQAQVFVANMRGVGRDLVELARLEARLALAGAVSVAIFSVAALILIATGWVLLIAALVAWIADTWLELPAALLLVGLVLLACAMPCALIIRRRAGDLGFHSTRRQLEHLRHGE